MRERLYSHRVELAAKQRLEVTLAAEGYVEGFEVVGSTDFWVERIVPHMYGNIVTQPVPGDLLNTIDIAPIQRTQNCQQFTFTFRGRAEPVVFAICLVGRRRR